jgi:hypothetical protein
VFQVEVAVVASWLPRFEPPVGGNDLDRRYNDRLKVALDVAPGETLRDVYRRSVELLQPRAIEGSDGYVEDPMDVVHWAWFYEEQDAEGIGHHKIWEVAEQLTTVNRQELAVWHRSAAEIPYEDVVRAGKAGVLRGDPLRPYLVLLWPQGPDLIQTAWHDLVLVWSLVGDLLNVRELFRIAHARRERLGGVRAAAAVVEKRSAAWASRGGAPLDVKRMLDRQPWSADDLRMLLGLETVDEAIALLEAYGFERTAAGEFDLGQDEESRLLSELVDEASRGGLKLGDPELKARERIEQALETGHVPPWSPFP